MPSNPQSELQRFRAQVSHFFHDQTYVQKAALGASKKRVVAEQDRQSSLSVPAIASSNQVVPNLQSVGGNRTSRFGQIAELIKCLYPECGESSSKGTSPDISQPKDDPSLAASKFFQGTFQNRLYIAVFTGLVLLLVLAVSDPSVSVLHKHLEEVQNVRAERDLLQSEVSRLQQELKDANDRAQQAQNFKGTPTPAHATRGQEKELEQALVLANQDGGGALILPVSAGSLPVVDWEWIFNRTHEDRTLIVVRMWVLDVTDYKNDHPGGDVFRAGEDMTQAFYDMHACFPDILELVKKLVVATVDQLAKPPLAALQPKYEDKEVITILEGDATTNDEANLSCLDSLMDLSRKPRNPQWFMIVGMVFLVAVLSLVSIMSLSKMNAMCNGVSTLNSINLD